MTAKTKGELPILPFVVQEHWEQWLEANHDSSPGLWLKLAKKSANIPSVTYPEAVDSALCFGWIDGQKASYDDQYWLQRFTKRRPQSKWSKRNCERATILMEQGRVKPSGMQEIEKAMADGRWEKAYEPQSTMPVPVDFLKRLEENPKAKDFFDSLNSSNRYAILYQIQDAKRPDTRARRIEKFVTMLMERKKLY